LFGGWLVTEHGYLDERRDQRRERDSEDNAAGCQRWRGWSTVQRPHQARESLFVALAGNPATAAERGLAEIAEPRPDTALT
jgi:hypothetical protein